MHMDDCRSIVVAGIADAMSIVMVHPGHRRG